MAVELATAYISIVADTGQLAGSIKGATSGMGSPMEKQGSALGSKMMKGIGGGLLMGVASVAAAGVATLGTALYKGFGRLNSLDQATAKLSGLGHSAEAVDGIMKNALASVRGTAFGMDEAAGVAAGLVAANVKPGQDLERSLKLVADASTIAGVSMGEMGGVFNKVAGSGKIQGDVIAQLGDKGIPILQLLAKEMGVSAEEVSKMASNGEIDFARFQNAMEKGMGGAALKSGETFKGALANVNASLGRIGANLLSGSFAQFAPTLSSLTGAMGPLEDGAKRVGAAIGEKLVPAFEWLRGALSGEVTPGWLAELSGGFTAMFAAFKAGGNDITSSGLAGFMEGIGLLGAEVAGGIRAMFGAFKAGGDDVTSSGLAGLMESIGLAVKNLIDTDIMSFLSPMGVAFQVLQPVLPQIADALTAVVMALSGGLGGVLDAVVPILGQLVEMLSGTLAEILPVLVPIITQIAGVFGEVLLAVMPLVASLLTGLMPVLSSLLGALMPILEPLMGLVTPLLDLVMAVLPPLIDLLMIFVPIISGILTAAFEYLGPVIAGVADALGTVLTPIITTLQDVMAGLITFLTGVFSGDWEQAWQGIQDIFSGLIGGLGDIFMGVINGVIDIINGFIEGLNGMGGFLSDITGGTIDFTIGKIPHLAEGATIQPRRGGTLAVLAEAGRAESVVDTGLLNRALAQGIDGSQGGGARGGDIIVQPAPGMDEMTIGVIAARQRARDERGF